MRAQLKDIPVVVLCGGMGMRLREETEYRPKPLVEIGGRPILWHIMKTYSHFGCKKFVLCLGYKGHMIKQYFADYRMMNSDFTLHLGSREEPVFHRQHGGDEDWQITFVNTGPDAMTGARVKRVQCYISCDHFMLTYGDGVGNINIRKLWEFHLRHGKIGTVTGVRTASRYGELVLDGADVKDFSEKPQSKDGFISGGFFVFHRRFFNYLRDDDACILEKEPLEGLTKDGELTAYRHEGFWHAMDTYRDFLALNEMWKHDGPWRLWKE
jgi:glucose-1-phosphate cytidylyltransferase